jgi:hypothetical protein
MDPELLVRCAQARSASLPTNIQRWFFDGD